MRLVGRGVSLIGWVLGLACGYTVGAPAQAPIADPPASAVSEFGQRYDGMRLVFAERGLELGTLEEFERAGPQDLTKWIVIAVGTPPELGRLVSIRHFLQSGGTLAIITDGPETLEPVLDLRVERMVVRAAAGTGYRQFPECPVAEQFRRGSTLFSNVRALAFNDPSLLTGSAVDRYALAWFGVGTRINGEPSQQAGCAMAGGAYRDGRFLVIADSSLLINEMLMELDNLTFARNLADWLLRGRPADQCRVLFFENEAIVARWIDPEFELGPWRDINLETLIPALNEVLVALERDDLINDALRQREDQSGISLRRTLVWIGSQVLLLAVLFWLLRLRRPTNLRRVVESTSEGFDEFLLVDQELLQSENYALVAVRQSERFWQRVLGTPGLPDSMPSMRIAGGPLVRWPTEWNLRRVWRLALDGSQKPMNRKQYLDFKRRLDDLDRMVELDLVGPPSSSHPI